MYFSCHIVCCVECYCCQYNYNCVSINKQIFPTPNCIDTHIAAGEQTPTVWQHTPGDGVAYTQVLPLSYSSGGRDPDTGGSGGSQPWRQPTTLCQSGGGGLQQSYLAAQEVPVSTV